MSYANQMSRRLAAQAEAVCRAYLPQGRHSDHYWIAGDVQGTRGKSLFVKLIGDGAGRWTDGATGEHGDLLDLIRLNKGFHDFRETLEEARYFLREPQRVRNTRKPRVSEPQRDTVAAADKLYRFSRPVPGTLAETYLRGRAIAAKLYWPSLRFHAACYYRPDDGGDRQSWPALLGIVTDLGGNLTGLQRTWLARDGGDKAPLPDPRRAMGRLLGNAVRFGTPNDIMAASEGIETVLSLLSLFPALPMAAGLSASHLAAIRFPPGLCRLYVLRDNDGRGAGRESADDRAVRAATRNTARKTRSRIKPAFWSWTWLMAGSFA
jgi:hypothetical protein